MQMISIYSFRTDSGWHYVSYVNTLWRHGT